MLVLRQRVADRGYRKFVAALLISLGLTGDLGFLVGLCWPHGLNLTWHRAAPRGVIA